MLARVLAGLVDLLVLGVHRRGDALFHAAHCRPADGRGSGRCRRCRSACFCCCSTAATSPSFTTAGGQTIGKMLARIKVVADPARRSRRSAWRAWRQPRRGRAARDRLSRVAAARWPRVRGHPLRLGRTRAARSPRRDARREGVTRLAVFLATAATAGYFPIAPGTVGSAAGLAVYVCSVWSGRRSRRSPRSCSSSRSSRPACGRHDRRTLLRRHRSRADRDRRSRRDADHAGVHPRRWPSAALAGFFLFRVFDVIKPFPARRFEALHGGLGVMADDAMAAIYANVRFAC